MAANLEERITISLPRGTLLVLFEYLARSYGGWQKNGTSLSDAPFSLLPPDAGERNALWHFEGAIERTLPEIFAPDYQDLLLEWKRQLVLQNGS